VSPVIGKSSVFQDGTRAAIRRKPLHQSVKKILFHYTMRQGQSQPPGGFFFSRGKTAKVPQSALCRITIDFSSLKLYTAKVNRETGEERVAMRRKRAASIDAAREYFYRVCYAGFSYRAPGKTE